MVHNCQGRTTLYFSDTAIWLEWAMAEHQIALIYGATDTDQVDEQLVTIWQQLEADPKILSKAGIDPATIKGEENPFAAGRTGEGSAILTGIAIAAGGRIAGEILVRLWDDVIWPRLRTRIPGVSLDPPPK
jgi:hypothetical protein